MRKFFLLLIVSAFFFAATNDTAAQTRVKAKTTEAVEDIVDTDQQVEPRTIIGTDRFSTNKGFYLQLRGGYSTTTVPTSFGQNQTLKAVDENGVWTDFSVEDDYSTLGDGMNIAAHVGYMFSEHFGAELGIIHFRSGKHDKDIVKVPGFTDESVVYSNQFRAAISLVAMGGGAGKALVPYTRFGILMPLSGSLVLDREIRDEVGNIVGFPIDGLVTTLVAKTETEADASFLPLGFTGAAGAHYRLTDNISLFGEVSVELFTVKAKQTVVTDLDIVSVVNGEVVELFSFTEDDRSFAELNINYVQELTQNSNYLEHPITGVENPNFDKDKAEDQLALRGSYNGVGLNIGVRFKF